MASYSMASMTDVIFLLLIFFMVTSTFVSPTALEVDLPKSSEQTAVKKPSTKDDQLLAFLQMTQQQDSTQVIALYADESVPYGRIVEVLDMTSRHNLKMVLATKPTEANDHRFEQAQETQPDAAATQQ